MCVEDVLSIAIAAATFAALLLLLRAADRV